MWEELLNKLYSQFGFMSTRSAPGDAIPELLVIIMVSFILGFLFCYVQGKSRD